MYKDRNRRVLSAVDMTLERLWSKQFIQITVVMLFYFTSLYTLIQITILIELRSCIAIHNIFVCVGKLYIREKVMFIDLLLMNIFFWRYL
jgi:hypothetical protein